MSSAQPDGSPPAMPPRDVPRIIVADDNATNRLVLTGFLKRLGLEAEVAVDGAEAVHLATSDQRLLVLMDIQMPNVNGIEAAVKIRAHPPEAGLTIIAVTACGDTFNQAEFERARFDKLITKPVSLNELKHALSDFVDLTTASQTVTGGS